MSNSSNYEKYLKDIQSKQVTDVDLIDRIVVEATGSVPLYRNRIIAGEINEVYDIGLKNGRSIITRINLSDSPSFLQEKWAIDQCHQNDIPAPRIIALKSLPIKDKVLSFCLLEKIDGEPLGFGIKFKETDTNLRESLVFDAGKILSKIHQIPVHGFGHLDGNGQGTHSSFREVMSDKLEKPEKILELPNLCSLSQSDIKKSLKTIEKKIKIIEEPEPVMVHGDFGPKHIMFKNREITGIIDFGDVLGHSPIFDIARWEYFYGNNSDYKKLLEGYTNKKNFSEKYFQDIFDLIQLDMGLSTLYWYCSQKYQLGIQENTRKITKILSKN